MRIFIGDCLTSRAHLRSHKHNSHIMHSSYFFDRVVIEYMSYVIWHAVYCIPGYPRAESF